MGKWYCQLDGEISGPLSLEELHYLINRGKVDRDVPVRMDHQPWQLAGNFDKLFPAAMGPQRLVSVGVLEPHNHVDDGNTNDGIEPNAITRPDLPELLAEEEPQSDAAKKAAIIAAILFLLLLLIWLLMLMFGQGASGGSQGAIAGTGVGEVVNQGIGDGNHSDGGHGLSDAETGTEATDIGSDEIVFEGELSDAIVAQQSVGDKLPEAEPPPNAMYQVKQFAPPAQPQAGGGGGGGLGDFKDRLDREGGQTGDVQITLIWNNVNDLDLHVICPSGERISYQQPRSACNGELDVDMNAGGRSSREPVENVFWPVGGAPTGRYEVVVDHYATKGAPNPTKFEVAIKYDGRTRKFSGQLNDGQQKSIHTFEQD